MQTVLIILLILAGLALILTGLYLFLIMPRLRKPAAGAAPLTTSHFAHRGYFTEEEKNRRIPWLPLPEQQKRDTEWSWMYI